jgi:hypothetical protein
LLHEKLAGFRLPLVTWPWPMHMLQDQDSKDPTAGALPSPSGCPGLFPALFPWSRLN